MMGLQPKVANDQLAAIPGVTVPLAAQACATCKKQKRKCDKLLPACSRCASLQRPCDYSEGPTTAGAPSAQDFAALQMKLADLEARLESVPVAGTQASAAAALIPVASSAHTGGSGASPDDNNFDSSGINVGAPAWPSDRASLPPVTNRFPTMLFLDIDTYNYAKALPPKPSVPVPAVSLKG